MLFVLPSMFSGPIQLTSPITTANVKAGDGIATENFFAIATWTNRGNHPITGMSPVTCNV